MNSSKENDIFNKVMLMPILKSMLIFCKKHKEIFMYLFFGGLGVSINIILFAVIDKWGVNELINNAICWIVCVMFQFFTNRTWVFDVSVSSRLEYIKQMGSFVTGRLLTLILEEILLAVFITWLGFNIMYVKLSAQVVVIVLNYIISKLIVFKR